MITYKATMFYIFLERLEIDMNKIKKQPLIVLTGPTAVGKTSLSIQLAKAIHGEIISADSMQVYKEMNIGTAKITPKEMCGVSHYLVDEFSPDEEFNVAKFKQYADKYIHTIYEHGHIPILVGGTGFYIQAVLNNIDFEKNDGDTAYRKGLEELAAAKGSAYLYDMLKKVDIKSTETIHENNVKRVIRALEFYHQTGKKISEHNEQEKEKESPYQFAYFVLTDDREVLYDRINKRVDIMAEQGLLEEVTALRNKGYTSNMVSMQGIGYKEIMEYLDGACSYEAAINKLKQNTRHFAKRQLTWFKREREVIWVNKKEFKRDETLILQYILEKLKEKQIGVIEDEYNANRTVSQIEFNR